MKQRKARVSVTIDKKIYEKAHELGINVSKVSENALVAVIDALEQANTQNSLELTKKVRSPGFEPGSSAWQSVDWQGFRQWIVNKQYRGSWRFTVYGLARQYGEVLFSGDLSGLAELSDSKRSNALKALSALSKFLGCYDRFQRLRKDYGLTWSGKSSDDLIIERLTKAGNTEEVWSWIKQAKKVRRDLVEFLDLISVTGLRVVEAVACYNLIVDLQRKHQLDTYYQKGVLEHFKFKETFIRKSKKVFVSFVPETLVAEIALSAKVSSPHAISASFRRNGFCSRFSDVREAHGTFMTKYLKPAEIDFLHGRCSNTTFMKHYFNPALIKDLRERVFKGINEIQEKIKL